MPPADVVAAARELGMEPAMLLKCLASAHRSNGVRMSVDGRVTDDCATCGCRMKRLGFAYWVEEEDPNPRSTAHMFGDGFRQSGPRWYAKTRKDAKAWALGRRADARGTVSA